MKNIYLKLNNEKGRTLLAMLSVAFLLIVFSCTDNEKIVYGIDDEASAAIGFINKESIAIEAGDFGELKINASKLLFHDVAFELVVLGGDDSGIVITDLNGVTGTKFIMAENTKTVNLKFEVTDDSEYVGDREIRYGLTNLVGPGAYLLEENLGSSENRVYAEFTLTVVEDEPVPPSISFNSFEGKVDENTTEAHKVFIQFTSPAIAAGSFDLNFSGTAVQDLDYTSNAVGGLLTVNFTEGTEGVEIEIMPIDNTVIEDDKTIILDISNISDGFLLGGIPSHTLTILENDLPIEIKEIVAEADAWTRGRNGSSKSNDNGGDKTDLVASNDTSDNNFRQFFMRFDLTGINPSKIIEAKLVFTTVREDQWGDAETNAGGVTTQNIYHVTDDSWGEMTVTANNSPASGTTPIASFTSDFLIGESGLANLKHEFDVTSQLQVEADGKLSIRLSTDNNTKGKRLMYSSREGGADNIPLLIVKQAL